MSYIKNKGAFYCLFIILTCCLLSCAPNNYTIKEYGFFSGILHGLVFMFALIAKILGMDYGLYAENNSGFTYWLGFIIGFLFLGGSGYGRYRRD